MIVPVCQESKLIDRKARDKAAELVRRFVRGQISNFEFEGETPNTVDRGVLAIVHSLWCFYDDFEEHKLSGKRAFPVETKKQLIRWIVFLHTDEEYLWPEISYPGVRPTEHGFFSRLFKEPEKEREFMKAGDYSVWPFISKDMFNRARKNPKLLGRGLS